MEFCDGEDIPFGVLQQPKAEAEIALILGEDLDKPDIIHSELVRAIEYVCPAIEIVGSRVQNWDIKISDTIADNASSGVYVLGGPVRKLEGIDLVSANMVMKRNGQPVSFGAGIACLGNPLNAALWLARKCVSLGMPLRAGDVVLTGALGPMVSISAGDVFEVDITGLGSVRACIGQEK